MRDDPGVRIQQILGRFIFGLMSLTCTVAFGAVGGIMRFRGRKVVGLPNIVLRELLVHGFLFVAVFMLLITIRCWTAQTGDSPRIDRMLAKRTPLASVLILAFACTMCVMAVINR